MLRVRRIQARLRQQRRRIASGWPPGAAFKILASNDAAVPLSLCLPLWRQNTEPLSHRPVDSTWSFARSRSHYIHLVRNAPRKVESKEKTRENSYAKTRYIETRQSSPRCTRCVRNTTRRAAYQVPTNQPAWSWPYRCDTTLYPRVTSGRSCAAHYSVRARSLIHAATINSNSPLSNQRLRYARSYPRDNGWQW